MTRPWSGRQGKEGKEGVVALRGPGRQSHLTLGTAHHPVTPPILIYRGLVSTEEPCIDPIRFPHPLSNEYRMANDGGCVFFRRRAVTLVSSGVRPDSDRPCAIKHLHTYLWGFCRPQPCCPTALRYLYYRVASFLGGRLVAGYEQNSTCAQFCLINLFHSTPPTPIHHSCGGGRLCFFFSSFVH